MGNDRNFNAVDAQNAVDSSSTVEIRDRARSFALHPASRLQLDLAEGDAVSCEATYAAYLVVNGELRDLPIGATLEGARLSWQPGPAFHGRYDFAVVRTDCSGRKTSTQLLVTIR